MDLVIDFVLHPNCLTRISKKYYERNLPKKREKQKYLRDFTILVLDYLRFWYQKLLTTLAVLFNLTHVLSDNDYRIVMIHKSYLTNIEIITQS